jgi:hypothetical protein
LTGINFNGWILIEASTEPADKIVAMKEQLSLFKQLVANIKKATLKSMLPNLLACT